MNSNLTSKIFYSNYENRAMSRLPCVKSIMNVPYYVRAYSHCITALTDFKAERNTLRAY
jgi:hypothetical protein